MAQVTLYFPDELEKQLRRAAKRAKKSLSAYVVDLTKERIAPARWPKALLDTYGSWEGPFPEVAELPFEERDEL